MSKNDMDDELKRSIKFIGLGVDHNEKRYLIIRRKLGEDKRTICVAIEDIILGKKQVNVVLELKTRRQVEYLRELSERVEHGRILYSVATKPGPHKKWYILPNGEIIGPEEGKSKIFVAMPYAEDMKAKLRCKGDWKGARRLGELAVGNRHMMFGMSLALAGLCVDYIDTDQLLFQFVGSEHQGKSTLLECFGSMLGRGEAQGAPFMESWNNTVNKLEIVAAKHDRLFLGLDEAESAEGGGRAVLDAIFRLHEGQVKGRMPISDVPQITGEWKFSGLATANRSLRELALDILRKPPTGAQFGRMIDIGPGVQKPFVQKLHGSKSLLEFLNVVRKLCREHQGHHMRKFIERLLKMESEETGSVKAALETSKSYMLKKLSSRDVMGRDTRVDGKFATVYAVGQLARKLEICQWEWKEWRNCIYTLRQEHYFLRNYDKGQQILADPALQAQVSMHPWDRLVAFVNKKQGQLFAIGMTPPVRPRSFNETAWVGFDLEGRKGSPERKIFMTRNQIADAIGSHQWQVLKQHPGWKAAILADKASESTKHTIWADEDRQQGYALRASAFTLKI